LSRWSGLGGSRTHNHTFTNFCRGEVQLPGNADRYWKCIYTAPTRRCNLHVKISFFGIPYIFFLHGSDRQTSMFSEMIAKIAPVWHVAPSSLLDCYRNFGGIYFLHVQAKRQCVPPELR
jgi:hypothetical protein